jgi:hypothetical protein
MAALPLATQSHPGKGDLFMSNRSLSFSFDLPNLIKAAPIPLVVVAAWSLLRALGLSVGVLTSIVTLLIWLFCGAWYARTVLQTGSQPGILNLALNGALLGVAASVVDDLVWWIGRNLRVGGITLDLIGMLTGLIYVGIIVGLATVAWYAYQTEKR